MDPAFHKFDAVVVGSGGAGLMASLQLADASIAVLTKVYPTRSHTGAAQGGIGAALGNIEEDHWQWHMFDTVKGGDYLVDQDAAEILARDAIDTVYELEHMGLPFSRTPDGRLDQRRFGGHTRNFGEGPVRRSCYAADRTGHMILQTMYQQAIKKQITFFNEFQMLDLLVQDNVCSGVIALEVRTGDIHIFHTKAVVLATGGYGKIYKITSNALASTGDGVALAFRRGIPLEDMEMYQFHPTGIYKLGILLSEAARGEGGILRNVSNERFMERYTPTLKDLAPRDMVSRFIYKEIREGRGIGPRKDYVHLDLTHLGKETIDKKLPDITDFVRTYQGIEPITAPIPIQPTAHYAMGGIPTDNDGRVIVDENQTPVYGLYAAGECACVSVHGANRLGTNSLVDILVFGRRSGKHMARYIQEAEHAFLPSDPTARAREEVNRLRSSTGKEKVGRLRQEMQEEMMDKAGIVRTEKDLLLMQQKLVELRERYGHVSVQDQGKQFNTDLLEALEFGYMLDISDSLVASCLARKESRGAHYREDYPNRDDANFLKHTLAHLKEDGQIELTYKPVMITEFQPKERKY